ncbi:hypothetical protein FQR65_LT11168 [Abscondita terminalis]|nr:hypothetical protein FQR65_LT11168 [Abscondita terminalis]
MVINKKDSIIKALGDKIILLEDKINLINEVNKLNHNKSMIDSKTIDETNMGYSHNAKTGGKTVITQELVSAAVNRVNISSVNNTRKQIVKHDSGNIKQIAETYWIPRTRSSSLASAEPISVLIMHKISHKQYAAEGFAHLHVRGLDVICTKDSY